MNLLMLTPQLPFPAHQGTTLRNYHIVRGLADDNRIDLLSYDERQEPIGVPEQLSTFCDVVETVPAPQRSMNRRLWQMVSTSQPDMALRLESERYAAALQTILQQRAYDIVQIEGIEMAWTIPIIRHSAPELFIVYDAHNAETVLQARSGEADRGSIRRWPAAAYSKLQSSRLAHYEAWACREADRVTAVSDKDREALLAISGVTSGTISVIPNSIDIAAYDPSTIPVDEAHAFDVVFSGKMDYRPNVDAVLWFADYVWPRIKAERPLATWAIVGQKPHSRIERLASLPDVTLTGWVADVKPYLAGAGAFIMPFRVGSGTRLKLIEALAAERAIVSTQVGVEGFPVVDGDHLLIGDTAEAFAAQTLTLLKDAERRAYLGRQGRQFAGQYDWRVVVPEFQRIYDELVQQ